MSDIDARETARYRQDVLRTYRAWLAYLEAQQTIGVVAIDPSDELDPFEGATADQERAIQAWRRIAALPGEQRALFDAVFETERSAIQHQLDSEAPLRNGTVRRADPEEATRRALLRLQEEARGLHRDDRRGLLPRGKPDAVTWLAIDLSEVAAAPPSETDYQLVAGRGDRRRGLILNIVFAGLALAAIPVLIALFQPGHSASPASGAISSGGAALVPWPILALRAGEGSLEQAMPVRTTSDLQHCAEEEVASACWQDGAVRPIRLCLPAARLATLNTLWLDAPAGLPTRRFTIHEVAPARPDLVVRPCEAEASTPARYGQFQSLEPLTFSAPGDLAPAGVRVMAIQVRGRGEDPELPVGMITLSVVVQDDGAHDWVALAPTLLLADGSTALPSATEPDAEQRIFHYLIADQPERFEVVWQVTPAADQVVRYRTALEPPPTRDSILRSSLQVERLTVTAARQTMTVQLTVRNTSQVPLVLTPEDLGFQTSRTHLEGTSGVLRPPLAPGEQRTVTLDLPLESGLLQVGPFRYQLNVRR